MSIRIDSADYFDLPGTNPTLAKFQTFRYTLSGQADYTVFPQVATSWRWALLVSASASALGGGVSAGGVDSLRASFSKTATGNNQITIVTNEAVTATAYFTGMQVRQQLSPTQYLYDVGFAKVE